MLLSELREPISALSHGAGMILALPVTWILWTRCAGFVDDAGPEPADGARRYQHVKALCLLVFGASLAFCYGTSALFHAVMIDGEPMRRLHRLDHVGIYLLIAGTYTPVAWAMMRRSWTWGTLVTVWTFALLFATRVWYGGVMPMWVSTVTYLAMGWEALFCYVELAKTNSHRTLLPLPLGGMFYSIGAVMNLTRWPVLIPGTLGSHELFHFLVIAGSTCHVLFMLRVVIPAQEHAGQPGRPIRERLGQGGNVVARASLYRPHVASSESGSYSSSSRARPLAP